MGNLLRVIFGGGGGVKEKKARLEAFRDTGAVPPTAKPEAKKLFTPTQSEQVSKRYGQSAEAKWQQILAGMKAGGPAEKDVSTGIASQAKSLAEELGKVTSESGFGETAPDIGSSLSEGPLANILKAIESQLSEKGQARYKLF